STIDHNSILLINVFPASKPPLIPNVMTDPYPDEKYLFAKSWEGCSFKPGKFTHSTPGCACKYSATFNAFSLCRLIRTCSVSTPWTSKHALCGRMDAPVSLNSCTRKRSANAIGPKSANRTPP